MRILALLAALALAAPALAEPASDVEGEPPTVSEAASVEAAATPEASSTPDVADTANAEATSNADNPARDETSEAAAKTGITPEPETASKPDASEPEAAAKADVGSKPDVTTTPKTAKASPDTRCTTDGVHCIAVKTYVADVCTTIERAATDEGLDPNFLARLLWKESLFEPSALSPKGAQGIAQFMPGTAQIVGLDDPFNPAKAIFAAAGYLRRLSDGFGNIGLAAVAYNGGEGRAQKFLATGGLLPFETQDYVEAITGHGALNWRDNPPKTVDLRLKGDTPFRDACITLAAKRTLKEFRTPERVWPWGVILASHPQQSGAAKQVSTLNRQLRPILGGKRVNYVRKRLRGAPKSVYTAQIGYENRRQANAFCVRLRQLGGNCIVLRN